MDLTAQTYETEGAPMPKKAAAKAPGTKVVNRKATTKPEQQDGPLDLSELTDEEFEMLLADDDETPASASADEVDPAGTGVEDEDDEVDEDDLDDDEDEEDEEDEDDADSGTFQNIDEDEGPGERSVKETRLSNPVRGKGKRTKRRKSVDLAEDVLDSGQRDEITQMRIDLAEERWNSERRELVRAGVPPFLLDLAAPIMSSPDDMTLDLSNADEPVSASKIVRDVIHGVKGLIDLTPQIGHQYDLSEDTKDDPDAKLLATWDDEYGTV